MHNLKSIDGRVVVQVDMEVKNWHTFEDGAKIRLERKYDNLDVKYTKPSQGIIVDGCGLPKGAKILFHPNFAHDNERIFNYKQIGGTDEYEGEKDIRYFSVPEEHCFLYQDANKEWQPLKNFCKALRVFEPYTGIIEGIKPKKIKDTLYILTGGLKGLVCRTLIACDYEIIFQGDNGKEERIIKCKHYEDEYNELEEIIAIDHFLTEKVNNGELMIGVSDTKCSRVNSVSTK